MEDLTEVQHTLLSTIKAAAANLNAQADTATKIIASINKELTEAGVGIEVWGPTLSEKMCVKDKDDGLPDQISITNKIGYERVDGQWCLAYGVFETHFSNLEPGWDCDKRIEVKPLLATPREVRISALPHMEGLLREIEKALNDALFASKNSIVRLSGKEQLADDMIRGNYYDAVMSSNSAIVKKVEEINSRYMKAAREQKK